MENIKVLVVDDESRMRKLVKDFLTREGYAVLEAGDGMEAMDIFYEDKEIALVILDVMMPKMDGWQVCREIRETSKVPITVFMILFGINFNLYFLLLLKDWKSVLKNEELRVYLGVVAAAIVTITINILSMYETVAHAFRYASFQVGAIITTTGFYTADFEQWPELSKTILMMLMVIGACGGSTGGGIKVSRFMILCKSIRQEIHKMLHPNAVTMVRMNGKKVGADTMRSINIYFSAYVFIIIVSVLLVSLDNFDFATSFSGVLTTINNVGPGISQVGPTDNFHAFSALSKIVFSFDMLFGRLEIFPYLLILSPDLWRKRF